MNKLFNESNPFWSGMGKLFDAFVLNVLWLVCCLPVFTFGPSTTAFYYAMINLVRGEETSVTKDFFRSFRRNFKQGLQLGIPLSAIGIFLFIDISMCYHAGTGIYTFFMVFFAVLFLLLCFVALYTFPLLAKFEKSNKDILIWAFTLSIQHLGKTIIMLAVLIFGIWSCHILNGLVFIAFGIVAELHSTILASILKPYLPDIYMGGELEPLFFEKEAGTGDSYET